jgi:hypothetical protein
MEVTMQVIVFGNYGEMTVDWETGQVVSYTPEPNENDKAYADIVKCDTEEYRRAYVSEKTPTHIDIIDIGYWTDDGGFFGPEVFHRQMIAEGQKSMVVPPSVIDMLTGKRGAPDHA